jgi:hypothetical protein
MNSKRLAVVAVLFLAVFTAKSQGVFIYDQQSTNLVEGIAPIQTGQPMGQSFTPSLTAIGFVDLYLYDGNSLQTQGATVQVNLRSGSVTGPILGTSVSVFMPNNFYGITNFLFTTPVSIVPGTQYFLQPVVVSGDGWGSYITDASYSGGIGIYQGVPVADRNLWFREGIVVPEPSSVALTMFGGVAAWWFGRRKARRA